MRPSQNHHYDTFIRISTEKARTLAPQKRCEPMQNTLLYEALASLTPAEWRAWNLFIASPFFNRKDRLIRFNEYYHRCFINKVTPQASEAWASAIPDKPFDDQKFRLDQSETLTLLALFWQHYELPDAPMRVAAQYRQRGLTKHYLRALKEAERRLEVQPLRDVTYYTAKLQLEQEHYQRLATQNRMGETNLQMRADVLDQQYIIQKLQYACLALSHQTVTKSAYNFSLFEAIIQHITQQQLTQYPVIALYYHCYFFLLDEGAEDHFRIFRQTLTNHGQAFHTDDLRDLHLMAINFGIRKVNQNLVAYYTETLELYRSALTQNLLLESGHLSRFSYNNIIAISLRIGEADWATEFAEKYRYQLEKKHQQASYCLNIARISYQRRDFGAALLALQQADYKDFISAMSAKILQMKIYFETTAQDLLEAHLDSMTTFLRRQRDLGYHRSNYQNIIKFTRAINRIDASNPKAIKQLKEKINLQNKLTEREWLLAQLDNLMSSPL